MSEEEKLLVQKVLGGKPCEKAVSGECQYVTGNCLNPLPIMPEVNCLPEGRWILCYGWKKTLGLEFVPELGVYLLPKCLKCGAILIEEVKKKHLRLMDITG